MDMRCLYNVRGNKVVKVIACTRNVGDRADGALSLQALNCIGVINAGFGGEGSPKVVSVPHHCTSFNNSVISTILDDRLCYPKCTLSYES